MKEYTNNQLLENKSDIDYKIFAEIKEHGDRVAKLALMIGKRLKLKGKELIALNTSALLHDYGKYYIPRSILLKPGKLTKEEMSVMKKHAYYSSKIAKHNYKDSAIADNVLYHHENMNGTGYYGLKGSEIPLYSRIIKVSDVFDALTHDRPYRQAQDIITALKLIRDNKDHYDNDVYSIFLNLSCVEKMLSKY